MNSRFDIPISVAGPFMLLVLDPHRGFCWAKESPEKLKVESNGFDRLNWEEWIGELANNAALETESDKEEVKKVSKIESKKEARRARKEQRIARLQKQSTPSVSSESSHVEFNPYSANQQIKKLHSAMAKGLGDVQILQFGSVALYTSDLDHLVPGEWLNDNNISLVYELLTSYFLKSHAFGHQVQLLYPSLVQLFLHYPIVSELLAILPKELTKLKFVFLPFNFIDMDGVDMEDANNGDHWALCILSQMEKKLYVFDSMTSDDDDDLLLDQLAQRLKAALFKPSDVLKIQKMSCDQQDNFDDCGVFLIMISCYLVSELISERPTNLDISEVKFNALSGRLFMMELVNQLRQKA